MFSPEHGARQFVASGHRRMDSLESPSRLSGWQRAQAAAIAAFGHPLIAVLGRTLRWQVGGFEHFTEVQASGRQPVFAFWHGRILSATYFWRGRGIVVMTSENFDGEWIARIIRRFGYGTARGSTSRGSRRALVQLKRDMKRGLAAAFTVDGPRGPARSVHPGAVWLASATGNPIVPFHIEAAHHWSARSWDQTQIPKPFSSVGVAIGAAIEVPPGADDGVLEVKRSELEQSLNQLRVQALALLHG